MLLKKHIFIFFLVLFGTWSCTKDKAPSAGECLDFEFPSTGIVYNFYMYGKQYMAPCFNPNNPNEFVYYYRDYDLGITQLKKFNISSGQNSVIANLGKIYGQPKWGKNGWIAYTSVTNYVEHIYLVKDNGDSLRQLSNSTYNLSPVWDNLDNKIYWVHSPDLGSEWYFLRQDIYSNQQDTISTDGFQLTDILDGKLLLRRNIEPSGYNGAPTYYGYYDLNTLSSLNSDNFIPIYKRSGSMSGICWSNTNQYFYTTIIQEGLYKVNTISGQETNLISFCDSKRYETISCSSDGKYLVAERVDSSIDHEQGKIIEKRKIYLINLVTLKEIEVNLE